MLEIEKIEAKLADKNLSWVARETGLSYQTVWKVAKGRAGKVTYDTIRTLSDYLEAQL